MNQLLNNLYPFDYILLIITFLFVFFSVWKGFIQSILGLITWIGSVIVTLIFYDSLTNYLSYQINKIGFMEYSGFSEIISIIISIPLIFVISLIILRKIKTIISSDADKATLGVIADKLLGIIYGFIFSYFIFSTLLIIFEQINYNFLTFMNESSYILNNIDIFNQSYILKHIPFFSENSI